MGGRGEVSLSNHDNHGPWVIHSDMLCPVNTWGGGRPRVYDSERHRPYPSPCQHLSMMDGRL